MMRSVAAVCVQCLVVTLLAPIHTAGQTAAMLSEEGSVLSFASSRGGAVQTDILSDLEYPQFAPFAFLLTYLPFELTRASLEVKNYVRSRNFRILRTLVGDRRAVDAIYLEALRQTRGNTGMALLVSLAAVMDHQIVRVKIPILSVAIPLTSEPRQQLRARLRNVPRYFYSDSPKTPAGDRDKLQHFFGSAFLSYLFESAGPADRIAQFIEWGEEAFIVGGAHDERDVRANHQGREFGLALRFAQSRYPMLEKRQLLPSQFLIVQVVKQPELVGNQARPLELEFYILGPIPCGGE